MKPLEFPCSLPATLDDGCGAGEAPLLDEKPKTQFARPRTREIEQKEKPGT
jgi:hypothetical protein